MTAETLFAAIGGADEAFLEHSEGTAIKKPVRWRTWGSVAACLALVLAGTWALRSPSAVPEPDSSSVQAGGDTQGGCVEEFPGGIDPVLRVNGELYQWYGLNSSGMLKADENQVVYGRTCLPEGFEAVGEISSVVMETPFEDLQIQAGFPISGTVYTNPEAPLVVYAQITTDWIRECYVRFVSEKYQPGMICVGGKLYRFYAEEFFNGGRECYDERSELPQGAVYVGNIQRVVEDRYPTNDLEANNDDYYRHMVGREVYQDPADDSVIYLGDELHWSGGTTSFWRVCPLWEGNPDG